MTTSDKTIALEERAEESDRLSSPSAARNRDVVRDVFIAKMPDRGHILEVGAGTGEHAVHIAAQLPDVTWHPSDPDEKSRRSIAAWSQHFNLENIRPPLDLNLTQDQWWRHDQLPQSVDGILSLNMIHIAPFDAAIGLFEGASEILSPEGKLFLYGPFKREGQCAPSNHDFDQSLKSRNPQWGVRDLDLEIAPLALKAGLEIIEIFEMPANNLSATFRRKS